MDERYRSLEIVARLSNRDIYEPRGFPYFPTASSMIRPKRCDFAFYSIFRENIDGIELYAINDNFIMKEY